MPDLVEQMYCSQQIFIPPNLPSILKKYAKAAIRTQPGDLLVWSSAYFRALAAGIPPPTKERIEYPPVDSPSGLSPGFLKVLINQIGKGEAVSKDVLEERWRGVCLNMQALQDLLAVGMFNENVHWLEFLAICVGTLQPSLTKTMIQLCELLTEEPEGGSASIPVSTFLNLYKYLAKLDCGPVNTLEEYERTLKEDSETDCVAKELEPQEEEVSVGVPNIDWDTAVEGDAPSEANNEDTPDKDIVNETENPGNGETSEIEVQGKEQIPATDTAEPTKTSDDGALETDKVATSSQELDNESVTVDAADVKNEEPDAESEQSVAEGTGKSETAQNEPSESTRDSEDVNGLDVTKDEPLDHNLKEDPEDADGEGSNGGDSGVATADESQDGAKGEANDSVPVPDQKGDSAVEEVHEKTEESSIEILDQNSSEPEVKQTSINEVDATPAERTESEEKGNNNDDVTSEVVQGEEGSFENPSGEAQLQEADETSNKSANDTIQEQVESEESPPELADEDKDPTGGEPQAQTVDENTQDAPGERVDPVGTTGAEPDGETNEAPIAKTDGGEPQAQTVDENTLEAPGEHVDPVGATDVKPDGETTEAPIASEDGSSNKEEASTPGELEANKTESEDVQKPEQAPEQMLNIGSVYIIDDDGTLSGDLQERDSDKSIVTKPSDDGMMVWPDIKPEKEEIEAEPVMEKEVTSEDGIEVLTEVDIQPTREEIKMLPEHSEETQATVGENEENIFAPQIDSFTELLEAESAPTEELSPEELAAAEGTGEGDDVSRQIDSTTLSVTHSDTYSILVKHSTEPQMELMPGDNLKEKSERKPKKEVDIESLVKKDSEMMLLPTPVTSDIMLYVDNECDKSMQKVSPTQQLSYKMSLVDVQVAVPVDETVVEVFERHQYPKWMNIPGIGPVIPDHIIEEAEKYFLKVSELQEGMVMPRNIKHFHCPPLEINPECPEDSQKWSGSP